MAENISSGKVTAVAVYVQSNWNGIFFQQHVMEKHRDMNFSRSMERLLPGKFFYLVSFFGKTEIYLPPIIGNFRYDDTVQKDGLGIQEPVKTSR